MTETGNLRSLPSLKQHPPHLRCRPGTKDAAVIPFERRAGTDALIEWRHPKVAERRPPRS